MLNQPHPSLTKGKLALPLAGHCSMSGPDPHRELYPALGRDGPNRQGGTNPDAMGLGRLALPPRLRQVT